MVTMQYHVGDFIIRIKNAAQAGRREVSAPSTKLVKALGKVLVREQFLVGMQEKVMDGKKVLVATLRFERRKPRFSDAALISRPSLRVYKSAKDLARRGRLGARLVIVSTNKGVMTAIDAQKKKLGGEVLVEVW